MTSPRVVVLTTYFRPIVGGVESTAERLGRYLRAEGCAVRVVTKRVTSDLPDHDQLDGIHIERIGPRGARSARGKWQLLPYALAWLLRHSSAYDVVCCIDYRGIGVAAVLARTRTKRPVVLQAQTTGVLSGANADAMLKDSRLAGQGGLARALLWPVLASYRAADAFACISREIEREATSVGIEAERIHYLPNAVDTARFRPPSSDERHALRTELQIEPDVVVCLYVGRLSREKGLMDLMEAWRLLNPANALLLVAGPDMVDHPWNVGPKAREFAVRHELTKSVRFLGSISDVPRLLRVADIVVQPSHFEALGLSAIEALASGLPVVASAVGGLLDFLVDGENAALHPPRDPNALASCLRTLIENPARRQEMADRSRPSVLNVYDERVVFSRFADLLRHLTDRRG